MPYLEVNFDPFIALAKITNAPVSNPLNLISYVETVGAGGISFSYGPDIGQMNNLSLLRSMSGSRINVRVPADMQIVQKALLLRPDMITINDPDSEDGSVEIPSKLIKDLVASVVNMDEVGVALRLKPDVKQMKEAYQMGIDEVEIATNELAEHEKRLPFLECLERITHAIHIGKRNNLRVSVGGALDRRIISAINEVIDVEFISVGRALLAQAFLRGFETAIKELIEKTDIS
ncbi:MAG: pyridoxine 5'-phosphate synthase [Candidatus Marinimicrobia bacterium]|nr:pyridoxine 5'-phosphate synthase [Candidatus Neomarinimicrobiota bacterium]